MTAAVSLALLGGIEASSWASSITAAVALLGGVSLALLADDRGRAPGAARRAVPGAVVALAQVPELGRALGALDDGRRCSRRGPELPGLAQVLDEIEGIGPERCSAGITGAVVELAQVPELGRALGAGRRGRGHRAAVSLSTMASASRARPGARRDRGHRAGALLVTCSERWRVPGAARR
jgi:hypothetical protein